MNFVTASFLIKKVLVYKGVVTSGTLLMQQLFNSAQQHYNRMFGGKILPIPLADYAVEIHTKDNMQLLAFYFSTGSAKHISNMLWTYKVDVYYPSSA